MSNLDFSVQVFLFIINISSSYWTCEHAIA